MLRLALDEQGVALFNRSSANQIPNAKSAVITSGINALFKVINTHTFAHITKEIDFFKKYSNSKTEYIISSIEGIKSKIESAGSNYCIMRMAAGTGFHSITGDWQHDSYEIDGVDGSRGQFNRKNSAKSRKIATDGHIFEPMGFIKLTLLTEEELKLRKADKQKILDDDRIAREKLIVAKAAEIKIQKEEELKKETERLVKIEADRKAEEDRIAKARQLAEEREALIKAQQEDREAAEMKNKADKEKRAEELSKTGLEQLLVEISDYNEGDKIITEYLKLNKVIPESEYSAILVFLKRSYNSATNKERKNWKKFNKRPWSRVKPWVGHEIAIKWFEAINKLG